MPYTDYFQIIFSLSALLLVLYVMLKLSRSFQNKRFTREISVLDRHVVDNGVTLMIVKVRDQELLLSVANKVVTVLKENP